ncbi:MAG TPA: hypothetical protein DIU49_06125 [Desulfovibrio sp.]|nr:hypothetical protein [Desulfovibrio sp.]
MDAAVLARIERGEALLAELGFPGARLRLHGDLARIEVPAARIGELVAAAAASGLAERLGRLGCRFVTVDLAGYRMGSQNEPASGGDKTDS